MKSVSDFSLFFENEHASSKIEFSVLLSIQYFHVFELTSSGNSFPFLYFATISLQLERLVLGSDFLFFTVSVGVISCEPLTAES
jgi:hypothetical protein